MKEKKKQNKTVILEFHIQQNHTSEMKVGKKKAFSEG